MSLVHGGAAFKLFSPCVYNFVWYGCCRFDCRGAGVDEVPQSDVREVPKQVLSGFVLLMVDLRGGGRGFAPLE